MAALIAFTLQEGTAWLTIVFGRSLGLCLLILCSLLRCCLSGPPSIVSVPARKWTVRNNFGRTFRSTVKRKHHLKEGQNKKKLAPETSCLHAF